MPARNFAVSSAVGVPAARASPSAAANNKAAAAAAIFNVRGIFICDLPDALALNALAIDSLFFLLCCYLSIWGLRTQRHRRMQMLAVGVDYLFLVGMTGLVVIGFMIVYTLF